ncbi:DCC1-like thiol-disulfide oxidoreductase family protein, partial [Acinetobacter baumannii]
MLYDGACPLCRREIGVYQRGGEDAPLRFCDISRADVPATELPAGMTREQLLARFHVRRADGVVFSGAEAF